MSAYLKTRRAQLLAFVGCVLFAGVYAVFVIQNLRAERLLASVDPHDLERAALLAPWNSEARWQVGRYSLFVSQDVSKAISKLTAAVDLNPHMARYWLDLANTYQAAGDMRAAGQALDRALAAEPTSPDIAWEASNFYLVQNDAQRALSLLRVVVENDPEQVGTALSLCWRATKNVSQILDKAVPPNPEPHFTLMRLLMEQKESNATNAVWSKMMAAKMKFPVANAFPYFDYLIATKQVDEALQVWQDLAGADAELEKEPGARNLISNGGFERRFVNGGFGWRNEPRDQVEVSLDISQFHAGTRALRMVFTGPATDDTGVSEYVAVQPNTAYRFTAFVKSQDIASASGPRLVLQDAYTGQAMGVTEDLLGTSGWREQRLDLRTGPDTQLMKIRVARNPAYPLIKGTFWMDDLKLVEASPAEVTAR